MKRATVVMALAWAIPTAALAQGAANESPPESPMLQYLKQSGIESQLEQQRDQVIAQLKTQIGVMLDQMLAQFPTVPPELRQEMEPILAELTDSIASSYTIEEALAVYAAPFDAAYPGDALESALHQLSTPEGQKLVSTMNQAMSDLSEFQRSRLETAMQKATTKLVTAMQQAIKRRIASKSGAAPEQEAEPSAR